MGNLANQVALIERELQEYKENAGIEKNIIGMRLYKYSLNTEEGYILATCREAAREEVDAYIREDAKITELLDNEQLMTLMKIKAITTFLLPF